MRTAESITLAAFLLLMGLSALRPLPAGRRARVVAIGSGGLTLIWAAYHAGRFLPPLAASVVRDWLPSPLLLVVYWQAGQFFVQPSEGLQSRLLRLDRKLVGPLLRWLGGGPARAWIAAYLELAYLFCYPLVPLGLAALYLLHRGAYADRLWAAVLPPTFVCYVLVPFLQTLPPRSVEAPREATAGSGKVRSLNLWILRHASIHANVFPSAHVAASVATALALFPVAPWLALLFLCAAVSIAFGAVIGRYHYAADALAGAALALGVFLLETFLFPGS